MADQNWLFEETDQMSVNSSLGDLEMTAKLYDILASEYSGDYHQFLSASEKSQKSVDKKHKHLAQLVLRCYELKVPVEVYLRAQFEGLGYVMRRNHLSRPPMAMILSETGKERLVSYLERLEKSYVKPEDRRRALRARSGVDRLGLYVTSAMKFYERLQKVRTKVDLTKEVAIKELEMGARVGYFSAYYVAFNPLVDGSGSLYLQTMKAIIIKKLNEDQRALLSRARESLGVIHEEVGQYV